MNRINELQTFLRRKYPEINAFDYKCVFDDHYTNIYDKNGIKVNYCDEYNCVEIYGLNEEEVNYLLLNDVTSDINQNKNMNGGNNDKSNINV